MAKNWKNIPSRQPDRWNAYMREYRRTHPNYRQARQREEKAIALLREKGYTVTPCPADQGRGEAGGQDNE